MANELINPFQTFYDDGRRELARGRIEFYTDSSATVAKEIFRDSDLTDPYLIAIYELDDHGRIRGDVHYRGTATLRIFNRVAIFIRQLDEVVVSNAGNVGLLTIQKESVAAMISDFSLAEGNIIETQGYYAGTRFGGARYQIVAAGTGAADSFLFHNLGNGLQAALLEREQHNDFLVAGARGDGGSNDTDAMQAVVNVGGDITVQGGFVFAGSNVIIARNCRFVGGGTFRQLAASSGGLLQVQGNVEEVKFRGVVFDGNQLANPANASVSWVI